MSPACIARAAGKTTKRGAVRMASAEVIETDLLDAAQRTGGILSSCRFIISAPTPERLPFDTGGVRCRRLHVRHHVRELGRKRRLRSSRASAAGAWRRSTLTTWVADGNVFEMFQLIGSAYAAPPPSRRAVTVRVGPHRAARRAARGHVPHAFRIRHIVLSRAQRRGSMDDFLDRLWTHANACRKPQSAESRARARRLHCLPRGHSHRARHLRPARLLADGRGSRISGGVSLVAIEAPCSLLPLQLAALALSRSRRSHHSRALSPISNVRPPRVLPTCRRSGGWPRRTRRPAGGWTRWRRGPGSPSSRRRRRAAGTRWGWPTTRSRRKPSDPSRTGPADAAWRQLLIADGLLATGHLTDAFAIYRSVEAQLPSMVTIHESVAQIYERSGHAEWAARERTRGVLPADACATRKALCEFRAGRYRSALDAALDRIRCRIALLAGACRRASWRARRTRISTRSPTRRSGARPAPRSRAPRIDTRTR